MQMLSPANHNDDPDNSLDHNPSPNAPDEEIMDQSGLSDFEHINLSDCGSSSASYDKEEDANSVSFSGDELIDEEEEEIQTLENEDSDSEKESVEEEEMESRRFTTPEMYEQDQKKWEFIQPLDYTQQQIEMDINVKKIKERGPEEHLFTLIKDEFEFTLIAPFGPNPLYEVLTLPVDQDKLDFLTERLPYNDIWKLQTMDGFEEFARDLEFQGSEYRLRLLMKMAFNRAVHAPNIAARLEKLGPEVDLTTTERRRTRRAAHLAAAAAAGETPTGRKLPRRPIRLFAEEVETEEKIVKRRQLSFEE